VLCKFIDNINHLIALFHHLFVKEVSLLEVGEFACELLSAFTVLAGRRRERQRVKN